MFSTPQGFLVGLLLLLAHFTAAQATQEEGNAVPLSEGEVFLEKAKTASTYESKIDYLFQGLEAFSSAGDTVNVMTCYNKICVTHYNENNFLAYQDCSLKAWEYAKTHMGKEDLLYIDARGNLAIFYLFKEDFPKALAILKESLEQAEQNEDDFGAAIEANNIGFIYLHHVGDVERAIQYFGKAINHAVDFGEEDQPLLASFYTNKAFCLKEKQAWEESAQYFQKALELIDRLDFSEYNERTRWYCYQNRAAIFFHKKQNEKGLAAAQKALELVNTYPSIWDPQLTYETLGNYYFDQQNFPLALSFFEKSVAVTRSSVEVHKPVNAACRLAQALCDLQKYDAALDTLQQALQVLAPDFNNPDIGTNPPADALAHKKSGLALISTKALAFYGRYQQSGESENLVAALRNFQLASEIIADLRQSFTEEHSKSFLAKKANALYEKAIEVALMLHQNTGAEQYLNEAFLFAERNKSVSLLESIKENAAVGFGDLPQALLEREKEFKNELAFLNKLIFLEKKGSADPAKIKMLSEQLFELKEDHQDFEEQLEREFPKYYQIKYQPKLVGIADLRDKALEEQSVLLEYFVGEEKIFLFCISQQSSEAFTFLKTPALLQSFDELRAIISAPPKGNSYLAQLNQFNQQAPQLFQELLAPCLSKLPKHINKLYLIPDDFLNYLPFEILTLAPGNPSAPSYALEDQQYLFEHFRLTYHFSAFLFLQNLNKQYDTPHSFAGFAPIFPDLDYASSRNCENGELHRLQCNQKEVEDLSAILGGDAFVGKQASSQQLLQLSGQYDILHLATHACLDQEDPNFNRIYFTDDYLSNFDLTNCSLQANLVVLSACNTNAGSLVKGDGVMSLSKGFTLAGCPSVVTSLWAVDDCSTSDFMHHFYQNLKAGQAKDEALQNAKLDYLRSADTEKAHPYFWAPFLQFGEAQALDLSSNWSLSFYFLLILALGLFGLSIYFLRLKKA